MPISVALQVALIVLVGLFVVPYVILSVPAIGLLVCLCSIIAAIWLAKRWPRPLVFGSTIGLGIAFSATSLLWIVRACVPWYIATDYVTHDRLVSYLIVITCLIGLIAFFTVRRVGSIAYSPLVLAIVVASLRWLMPVYPTEAALRRWFAMHAATFTQLGNMLHEDIVLHGSTKPIQAFLTIDPLSRDTLKSEMKLSSERIEVYRRVQSQFGTLFKFSANNELFYVSAPGSGVANTTWGYVYAFDPGYLNDARPRLDSGPQIKHVPRFARLASPWFLYGQDSGVMIDGP